MMIAMMATLINDPELPTAALFLAMVTVIAMAGHRVPYTQNHCNGFTESHTGFAPTSLEPDHEVKIIYEDISNAIHILWEIGKFGIGKHLNRFTSAWDDLQGIKRRPVVNSEESDGEGGLGNVSRLVVRPPGHSGKAKRGHLCFDAAFECGNLGRADHVGELEYDLHLRPDTCRPRSRFWFNFTVENVKQDQASPVIP
ncbi:hypothetical protein EVAR_3221_1 [Eumeta japonica]|uniref:Cytosolic carboxypeptidase 6 n=1 Tax=Eumeta variegata TaxID=151549 RepID=A0A4C1SVL7_EUMVA|nr:hypothetical protein EVAR_3221_1 [Eumeta japonica]